VTTDGERLAVAFARVLRGSGLEVPVGSVAVFADALRCLGLDRGGSVYWAGRSTLVRRPEDAPVYDRAFTAFFGGGDLAPAALPPVTESVTIAFDDGDDGDPDTGARPGGAPDAGPVLTVRYSPHEVLRAKDFATFTHAELEEARRLMADVRLAGALRRSRRYRASRARRGRLDLRRTVRHALRVQGETLRRHHLELAHRPRRVVLICDVSGSMEPYARALLRFVQAAVAGRTKVEAFALGTRLTRVTRELASRDPDEALRRAAHAVVDWSGGTRLGDGMRTFNDRWGVRGMARGAVVVVLSDGWDRGDPALLAEQMERLRRVAHRVVWVNPLKAQAGYAPLARGMAAALRFVDEFVEGHSLESLEQLAEVIAR
jgi:hypothetical protein